MKKILIITLLFVTAFVFTLSMSAITKDYTGCYICSGQSGTYVKYRGSDDFSKRKKAENLGCKVGGTTSSCDASNYKILGIVD
jgi:hypothetical protein